MKTCIITYTNEKFVKKVETMISEIREIGKYKEDIVIIIGEDLKDRLVYREDDRVIVKYFPEIDRDESIEKLRKNPITEGWNNPEYNKTFMWHKLYAFHPFFKQWDKCLAMDGGMKIFKTLDKILSLDCNDSILAHYDGYPNNNDWKLRRQFDDKQFPEIFSELEKEFNLDNDYFQATMFVYDTSLLKDDTFDEIIKLSKKYFISKLLDQGIVNLYFNNKKYYNVWKQIQIKDDETFYYDYTERDGLKYTDYIMLKRAHTCPDWSF
jgi:hypothetical protein